MRIVRNVVAALIVITIACVAASRPAYAALAILAETMTRMRRPDRVIAPCSGAG